MCLVTNIRETGDTYECARCDFKDSRYDVMREQLCMRYPDEPPLECKITPAGWQCQGCMEVFDGDSGGGHVCIRKIEETDVKTPDMVNQPPHYKAHPSGVECITVTEHMGFNLGNCVKYIWRAGAKGKELEDLKKARWYLDREIKRLEKNYGND